MSSVHVNYVSKKISKIRWRPVLLSSLQHEKANIFATGSWDDEKNSVSVWKYPDLEPEDEDLSSGFTDPEVLSEIDHKGDVTDLKFFSQEILISASSNGSVNLYKYHSQCLQPSQSWERVHDYPSKGAPCSAVDSRSEEICSVGEDGKLALLSVHRKQVLWKKEIESCSLSSVCYIRQQEVAVSNIRGQLKVIDLRTKSPKASLQLSHGNQCGITCLGRHPGQAHLLVSGSEDGNLALWDMRQERSPVATLSAHSSAVTEAKFHPISPDLLYTCSLDGSLLQWDASKVVQQGTTVIPTSIKSLRGPSLESTIPYYPEGNNPWLSCDASKHRLDIVSLIVPLTVPIAALDIEDETLICSADNEAIYSVYGIKT